MSEAENDDYEEELDDEGWGDQSSAFRKKLFKLSIIKSID